jgi:hypothetical protein
LPALLKESRVVEVVFCLFKCAQCDQCQHIYPQYMNNTNAADQISFIATPLTSMLLPSCHGGSMGGSETGRVPSPRHRYYIKLSSLISSSTFSSLYIFFFSFAMAPLYVSPIYLFTLYLSFLHFTTSHIIPLVVGSLCYCCHPSCCSLSSLSLFATTYSQLRSGYPQPQSGLQQIAVGCWHSTPKVWALDCNVSPLFHQFLRLSKVWRRMSFVASLSV